MTERPVDRASIDSLYNANEVRYPQDASPHNGRQAEIVEISRTDQILIEVSREFNEETKYTVKRIPSNIQRNFTLLEKALTTTELSDENQPAARGSNNEIYCIDNGNSSESKNFDDYGDESASNNVQVVFIGGNEQTNSSHSSVKEDHYESD